MTTDRADSSSASHSKAMKGHKSNRLHRTHRLGNGTILLHSTRAALGTRVANRISSISRTKVSATAFKSMSDGFNVFASHTDPEQVSMIATKDRVNVTTPRKARRVRDIMR